VVVNHLPKERAAAEEVLARLRDAGARAAAIPADVADESAVVAMFDEAERTLDGTVDVLVNNAGVESQHPLVQLSVEEWRRVIDINLTGAFSCAREAARRLVASGREGVIVNVTSVHERIPWPGYAHYCASKAGLALFSQTIARELAPHGIRVVQVASGAVATPINRNVLDDPAATRALEREIPLGRIAEPHEIAAAVVWLASAEAGYVTGATLFVDGGMTLYPRFR